MKKIILCFLTACTVVMFSACSTMSTTGKGSLIGTAAGTAVGAGIGALIGKNAKGTIIGAASGAAVGAGVGTLIGKKMQDKKEALAAAMADAEVETITDSNGYTALKVTLSSGILFDTNKAVLKSEAKTALQTFASQMKTADMQNAAIQIFGHTDSTGSDAINQPLSEKRAGSVSSYLQNLGISSSRLTTVGMGSSDPVASNATAAGKAQNRRVEIYVLATDAMIQQYSN